MRFSYFESGFKSFTRGTFFKKLPARQGGSGVWGRVESLTWKNQKFQGPSHSLSDVSLSITLTF